MSQYMFFYYGGMPRTREETKASLERWNAWFRGIAEFVVDRGAPAKEPTHFGKARYSVDQTLPPSGYSIVDVDSQDSAIRIAEGCPIHEDGGFVAVAEVVHLNPI